MQDAVRDAVEDDRDGVGVYVGEEGGGFDICRPCNVLTRTGRCSCMYGRWVGSCTGWDLRSMCTTAHVRCSNA